MDMQQIFALMDRFASSPLTGLEVELEGARVRLEKGNAAAAIPAAAAPAAPAAAAPQAAPPPEVEPSGAFIKAPLVGTFYAAPAPDQAPFVAVGDRVKKGQTVCLIEAMKMMSEVPAPCDCVIEEVLKANGDLAAFGEALFRYKPC